MKKVFLLLIVSAVLGCRAEVQPDDPDVVNTVLELVTEIVDDYSNRSDLILLYGPLGIGSTKAARLESIRTLGYDERTGLIYAAADAVFEEGGKLAVEYTVQPTDDGQSVYVEAEVVGVR